jgi:hypothetical protein
MALGKAKTMIVIMTNRNANEVTKIGLPETFPTIRLKAIILNVYIQLVPLKKIG